MSNCSAGCAARPPTGRPRPAAPTLDVAWASESVEPHADLVQQHPARTGERQLAGAPDVQLQIGTIGVDGEHDPRQVEGLLEHGITQQTHERAE